MTLGGVAALIAAIAFVVLVIVICLNLSKVNTILNEFHETVKKLNTTIDVVTKDVDTLAIEVEGLLNKANVLVDDVNLKLEKTDPLFTAIGDVGESVSELNQSTKNMTHNLLAKGPTRRVSSVHRFIKRVMASKSQSNVESTMNSTVDSPFVEEVMQDEASKLESLAHLTPSSTAGEIKIN